MSDQWNGFVMELVSEGDWRHCEATRQAAAIAALGVQIAPDKFFRVVEGNEKVCWQHQPASIYPHFATLGPIKEVLRGYKYGSLVEKEPMHPLLDALRAISNVELIYTQQHLRQPETAIGYDAARQRTRLFAGAVAPHPGPYAKVTSPAKAAALAMLGFPLLAFEEADAVTTRYVLPRLSVPMVRDGQPCCYDAADLIAAERANDLAPVHPFALGCLAAKTWLQCLAHVGDQAAVLMFRGKGARGTQSSFVHSQADKDTIDRSEQFAASIISL